MQTCGAWTTTMRYKLTTGVTLLVVVVDQLTLSQTGW